MLGNFGAGKLFGAIPAVHGFGGNPGIENLGAGKVWCWETLVLERFGAGKVWCWETIWCDFWIAGFGDFPSTKPSQLKVIN